MGSAREFHGHSSNLPTSPYLVRLVRQGRFAQRLPVVAAVRLVRPQNSKRVLRAIQVLRRFISSGKLLPHRVALSRRTAILQSRFIQLCAYWSSLVTNRGLTLRSRRGPTASHQARRTALFIIRTSGLASCRRRPLSSNVRPRTPPLRQLQPLSLQGVCT